MGQDKIDLASQSTLVEQVAAFILNDLKKASPGSKILPERALAEKYNVSRKTVKNAITTLTDQGLLVRRVGKGTFVAENVNNNQHSVVNQLIYTDDFPYEIMSKVMGEINRPQELVEPAFFFGNSRVFDLYERSIQNMIDLGKKLDLTAVDEGSLPILAENGLLLP